MVNRALSKRSTFPLGYLAIGGMGVLAAWMVSVTVGQIIQSWHPGALLLAEAAAIAGAVVLRETLARERPRDELKAALIARELIILAWATVAVTLLLRYVPDRLGSLLPFLVGVWSSPALYVGWRDALTAVAFVGSWAFVLFPLGIVRRLHLTVEDLPKKSSNALFEDTSSRLFGLPDLGRLHKRLMNWVFGWLFVFVIAVGAIWQSMRTPWQVAMGLSLLVFCVLGLLLLAVSSFEVHRSRWMIEDIGAAGVSSDLFASMSGQLLATFAVIGLLVPAAIALALIRGVLGAILGLLAYLLSLLKTPAAQPVQQFAQRPVLPRPPFLPPASLSSSQQVGPNFDWIDPLLVVLGIAVALAIAFWLVRWWRRGAGGPQIGWMRALGGVAEFLWSIVTFLRGLLNESQRALLRAAHTVAGAPGRVITTVFGSRGPQGGTAADHVRYWYGQLVRTGTSTGLRRAPGTTAAEYSSGILKSVADAQADVQGLTDAYVTARYTTDSLTPEHAAEARTRYQAARDALRRHQRATRQSSSPESDERTSQDDNQPPGDGV